MFAVLYYFWPRWRQRLSTSTADSSSRWHFPLMTILATGVTGVVGFGLLLLIERVILEGMFGYEKGEVEELFKNLPLVASALFVVGVIIIVAGRREHRAETNEITPRSAVWIGLVQGLCLPFRGFSRSGATISTALIRGIARPLAEDFSFALAVVITPPVILRMLLRLLKAKEWTSTAELRELLLPGLIGMGFSFVAGLAALYFLSAMLEQGRWKYFGYYCLGAAVVVVVAALLLPPIEKEVPPPKEKKAVFFHSPLDIDAIRTITPLGNLNPRGGHVFPTDHIYLDYRPPRELTVHAPAKGTVIAVMKQGQGDSKIEVKVSDTFYYYLAHFIPEGSIKQGSVLEPGQVVGKTSGRSMFDLGCYDMKTKLTGFANPERYPLPTLHAVSPLSYFDDSLRKKLYAKVQRPGDKDGKIDLDVPGTLAGNWFLEGLKVADSSRGQREVWGKTAGIPARRAESACALCVHRRHCR
jgi:undecaprenyl-diphosphatase